MTALEKLALLTAAVLGGRWWLLKRRVEFHTKRRDAHDAKAWRLMRGGKP